MICSETDHYVNNLSILKKEKKTFKMYYSNDLNIRINKNPTLALLYYFSRAYYLFFSRKKERAYFLC